MRLVPDGDAAHQRQGQHLHVAIAKGTHREVMTGFVDGDDDQQDPSELQPEDDAADRHEQHHAEHEQQHLHRRRRCALTNASARHRDLRQPCRRNRFRIRRPLRSRPERTQGTDRETEPRAGHALRVLDQIAACDQAFAAPVHPVAGDVDEGRVTGGIHGRRAVQGDEAPMRLVAFGHRSRRQQLRRLLGRSRDREVRVAGLAHQRASILQARREVGDAAVRRFREERGHEKHQGAVIVAIRRDRTYVREFHRLRRDRQPLRTVETERRQFMCRMRDHVFGCDQMRPVARHASHRLFQELHRQHRAQLQHEQDEDDGGDNRDQVEHAAVPSRMSPINRMATRVQVRRRSAKSNAAACATRTALAIKPPCLGRVE